MSELISGLDVPRLIKDEVKIQYRTPQNGGLKEGQWNDFILDNLEDEFTLGDLINAGRWDFRIKPKTILLNGIEVPAPFEPKDDCDVWIIDDSKTCGYRDYEYDLDGDNCAIWIGLWRSESEIKQVVAALRSIFKGE